MPTTIRLHTAPGSLQRIDKGIRDADKAMMAMLAHTAPHLPPEVTDSSEFQRLSRNVLAARKQLATVLAIELELEDHHGPEVFEARV